MSYEHICAALELRLNDIVPPLPTSWENVPFTKPSGGYQRAFVLPANTQNPTFGDGLSMESGIFQISVCYPQGTGRAAAIERAEELRDWFSRGLTLTRSGIIVVINRKPSIAVAMNEPGYYVIPVSIPYYAYI